VQTADEMTLESRSVLKEGWLTLFKSKKTGLFNSKPAVSWRSWEFEELYLSGLA